MANRVVKLTAFALLIAFIAWIVSRVRDELTSDPFDVEN